MTGKPPDTSELLRRIEALERQAKILPSSFSSGQEDLLHGVLNDRLKSQQHESRDHLNRGLSPLKITPGTAGQVLTTTTEAGQVDATWAALHQPFWTPISETSIAIGTIGATNWHSRSGGNAGGGTGGTADSGTNYLEAKTLPIDPADYAAPSGKTLKFRLVSTMSSNNTDPLTASIIEIALVRLTAMAGGAGQMTQTGVTDINITYTAAEVTANLAGLIRKSTPTTLIAAGYGWRVTNHGAISANAFLSVGARLEYRHE